jgi:hypothetical protein
VFPALKPYPRPRPEHHIVCSLGLTPTRALYELWGPMPCTLGPVYESEDGSFRRLDFAKPRSLHEEGWGRNSKQFSRELSAHMAAVKADATPSLSSSVEFCRVLSSSVEFFQIAFTKTNAIAGAMSGGGVQVRLLCGVSAQGALNKGSLRPPGGPYTLDPTLVWTLHPRPRGPYTLTHT